jgi:hypothetical protein
LFKKEPFILFVTLMLFSILAVSLAFGQSLQTTCTVSPVNAASGVVRTEPGNQGPVLTFLVPDREYAVTGYTVAPNGSEWWSLDRAEFTRPLESDPWVSAEEVSPSGDCSEFTGSSPEATSAIISVRATLRAALGTESSSSFREGLWELALTNVAVDCGSGDPLNLGSQEAEDLILVAPSGALNTLLVDNRVFIVGADGSYHGQAEVEVASRVFDAELTLTIVSDTFMTGTWAASIGNCDFESEVELTHISDD